MNIEKNRSIGKYFISNLWYSSCITVTKWNSVQNLAFYDSIHNSIWIFWGLRKTTSEKGEILSEVCLRTFMDIELSFYLFSKISDIINRKYNARKNFIMKECNNSHSSYIVMRIHFRLEKINSQIFIFVFDCHSIQIHNVQINMIRFEK